MLLYGAEVCSGISRGVSGCPETPPPPAMIFVDQGVTPLLAPTLTSHLHLRRSETPLETNSGYATGMNTKKEGEAFRNSRNENVEACTK